MTHKTDPHAAEPLTWKRRLGRISWSVLRIYLVVVLVMMLLENSLVYVPSSYPAGDWTAPREAFEEAQFSSADGTRLHGWHLHQDNPRAVILFAHGNASNLTIRAPLVSRLYDELHVSVLVFDYRGFGKSEGRPNEAGVVADARAARAWLAEREGIAESDVVLFGRSLGTGVAVRLAAEDGVRGLVIYSGFTSLPDVAAPKYFFLPVRLVMRNRLNSAAIIGQYHGPLLQAHGTADEIIPYELGRALFNHAAEPKTFLELRGLGHNDPIPEAFISAFDAFIEELPPRFQTRP